MSLTATVEPYGEGAVRALAEILATAKEGDPLRLVTVIVPRGPVGLAVRRRLASVPPGIVNVRFLTLPRLAGELAVPWMSATGRRPATRAVVHEAIRVALDAVVTGPLAPAREQPAMVRALARTYGELRGASAAALAALSGQSERAAQVVGLIGAVRDRLGERYEEADLVNAAAAEAERDPAAVSQAIGPVAVYLPGTLDPASCQLILSLAGCAPVTVVLGTTGDEAADGIGRDLLARLGLRAPAPPATPNPVPRGTDVSAAPSSDAEVLLAVRQLMAANAAGTPLERMAIAHAGSPPYPRLVHDALVQAGIPFNGTGIRPLAATVPGRTLLGLFELVDHNWRRDVVSGWLTSAPLLHRGRLVPGTAWDVLSCGAGVVEGLEDWRTRPAAYAEKLRASAALLGHGGAADEGTSPSGGRALELRAAVSDRLAAFVEGVAERLAESPATWTGWGTWGRNCLNELLGDPTVPSDRPSEEGHWPPEEVAAFEAISEILEGLAMLDELAGSRPGPADFRTALSAELEVPAPQTSRFGQGVLVGRLADMVGLDLDVLCVVGMVDGAFPERVADDVLVPDREREAAGGELPLRAGRAAEARRDYLAALAAAPDRHLFYSTGDQRRGRGQRPSRLLLDTLETLVGAGRRLYSRDLRELAADPDRGYRVVPSFAAAVAGSVGYLEPTSEADWDLQSLLRWTEAGGRPEHHFLGRFDPVLRAGLELHRGRRSPSFSRFDGRIDGIEVPSPAHASGGGALQSATGLEAFAACPRRYLFGTLLGVAVRERPEAVLRVGGLERGNLVHGVLERFIEDELARPPEERIRPDQPWGPQGELRLEAIAESAFAELEQRGLTGRDALWRIDRAAILGDLRHFLREDDRYRGESGAVPEAVEQRFGWDSSTPVPISLGDGRSVNFRGTVDRIDRTPNGGLSVLDYKTGARYGVEGLDDDPVAGGTRLQLSVYGLAASRRYEVTGPVEVGYWFVSDKGSLRGRYPRDGFVLSPEREQRFVSVLQTLVTAIETGRFPGNPGEPTGRTGGGDHCSVCPFDRVCPPDRVRAWQRKRADPWIADYLELAGAR